jgi:predicted RNA-binding Zn-ribbon protein involved in translation (DUF1610 family)
LREILSGLKRRKPAKKYCPKCGDPHIRLSSKFDIWLLPEQYVCEKCGYRGPIVLEIEEEQRKKSAPQNSMQNFAEESTSGSGKF